jgi:RNA polymerase sigma-54 factor
MIQSLKMLQMNTLQLEEYLKMELEQNPILETEDEMELEVDMDADAKLEDDKHQEDDGDTERDDDSEYLEEVGGDDGIDWEEYLEQEYDNAYSFNEETDPNEERYETVSVYEETLEEHLMDQLAEKKVEERVRLLVQLLIGSLDDDGYLRLPIKDIVEFTGVTEGEVDDAFGVLWRLDPAGVGARDLRECLMLQLRARKMEDSLAMKIIANYWSSFEKMKIPELSRLLSVEPRQIQEAVDMIKTLDPKPGSQFTVSKSSVIIPDLIVEKVDGKFIVILNDRTVPSLSINKSYASMIRRGSKAKKEVKEYVREKFNSATWFIKSIEQRRTTMLNVMYAIIERQQVFFEKGPPNMAPLKQQEVADMIKMNISTISRVTSNKYVQTPHGIFELKYFFTESIGGQTTESGADVTAERVKDKIKQIIEDEDPKKPITDQKIAEILEAESLPAARRTVAKYREQMKILPARMRQKYD